MHRYPCATRFATGEEDRLPWQAQMGQDTPRQRSADLKDTMRPVLGIETSCDETAVAVVDGEGHILAEMVLSQLSEHEPYGGVVPEIAARAHLRYLPDLVGRTMARANLSYKDLGGIAATSGPGLIGGLIVGSQFGKGIAIAHDL